MSIGKIRAFITDKNQSVKQVPLKIVQTAPEKTELIRADAGTIIYDEQTGLLYIKGTKETYKFQGVKV